MKVKTKLIASIMSICLVCAVFAIGVFALKTANLKIGGDVSFKATGVEAHIKNASLTGLTTTNQDIAANDATGKKIDTSMTQSDIDTTFATWQNLTLDFNENGDDIVFKFDIANTSANADNYIEIDYSYSFSNSSPNVDVFPGDENAEDVWENNNYILAPKGSAETATYETFTLKFKVLNKELNVPQDTKVSVTIALKHHTAKSATADANNVVTIDNIKYKLDSSANEAQVSGHTLTTSTDVNIYPVVSDGNKNYIVTSFASGVFSYGAPVVSITIPNSITSFASGLFEGCPITTIIIPKSMTELTGSMVFAESSLQSIKIPNYLKAIEGSVFSGCTSSPTFVIDSQDILSSFTGSWGWAPMTAPNNFYVKAGLDVTAATYLTNTVNFTPEKVGDTVADADGDGYILYTKVGA